MRKTTLFISILSIFLITGCDTPSNDSSEFPTTYQNFVNCEEQTLERPEGEEIQTKGTVKLLKEAEGTKNEWKYYVLDTGEKQYILQGGSGWGVPDYNYGNTSVAPIVNTEVEVKGIPVTIDSYKNSDEAQYEGKTDEGLFLTEIAGYYPMCCNSSISDGEADMFEEEAKSFRVKIENIKIMIADNTHNSCVLMKTKDVEECRRRILNQWRTKLKKYEFLALNKHTPEQQCFWANPYK